MAVRALTALMDEKPRNPQAELKAVAGALEAFAPLLGDAPGLVRALNWFESVVRQYGRAAVRDEAAALAVDIEELAAKLQAMKAESAEIAAETVKLSADIEAKGEVQNA